MAESGGVSPPYSRKNKKAREVVLMDSTNKPTVQGESIRLRLTKEMKEWLFEKSAKENRSVSDIMRSLIYSEMETGK